MNKTEEMDADRRKKCLLNNAKQIIKMKNKLNSSMMYEIKKEGFDDQKKISKNKSRSIIEEDIQRLNDLDVLNTSARFELINANNLLLDFYLVD